MVSGQKGNTATFLSVRTCLSGVKVVMTLLGHRGPRSPPHGPSWSLHPVGQRGWSLSLPVRRKQALESTSFSRFLLSFNFLLTKTRVTGRSERLVRVSCAWLSRQRRWGGGLRGGRTAWGPRRGRLSARPCRGRRPTSDHERAAASPAPGGTAGRPGLHGGDAHPQGRGHGGLL